FTPSLGIGALVARVDKSIADIASIIHPELFQSFPDCILQPLKTRWKFSLKIYIYMHDTIQISQGVLGGISNGKPLLFGEDDSKKMPLCNHIQQHYCLQCKNEAYESCF